MTIYLTEKIDRYDNPNHAAHGAEILTVTLWADDERIQNFGGGIGENHAEIRAKARKAANDWDGLTGEDVRAYDEFIRKMDRKNWTP